MKKTELQDVFKKLGLDAREAASVLSVDVRTVTRWLDGTIDVPGPAAQALRAWIRLENATIPWRPDGLDLRWMKDADKEEQVRLMREHVVSLDEVMERVRKRGGPAAPWKVDLKRRRAELTDTMVVSFYMLKNGNFSPSSYRRTDKEAVYERDRTLIEDAVVCIADAIGKANQNSAGRN